jgi:hypothetical protein
MRHDTALMMTKSTSISFYDTFYSLLFGDLSESLGIAQEFHGTRTVDIRWWRTQKQALCIAKRRRVMNIDH